MKAEYLERDFGLGLGGEKNFLQISSIGDAWLFLEGPFLQFVLAEEQDSGRPIAPADLHFLNQHNRLGGGVRLRQVRMPPDSCDVPSGYRSVVTRCYADYDSGEESRAPFSGAPGSGRTYNWTSASQNGEATFWGQLNTYAGSGYVMVRPGAGGG